MNADSHQADCVPSVPLTAPIRWRDVVPEDRWMRPERQPEETFAQYRERRRAMAKATKRYLRGVAVR